jgi:hypothetical protein
MFTTYENTRVGFPGLFGEGCDVWAMVERDLHSLWFHVSIATLINGGEASRILMPGSESMFEQVLAQQSEEIQVTDIQVVTPAWVNGQERWMMERLIKLEAGYDADNCLIHIISVESGAVYSASHGARCVAADLRDARVIYCRVSSASAAC